MDGQEIRRTERSDQVEHRTNERIAREGHNINNSKQLPETTAIMAVTIIMPTATMRGTTITSTIMACTTATEVLLLPIKRPNRQNTKQVTEMIEDHNNKVSVCPSFSSAF